MSAPTDTKAPDSTLDELKHAFWAASGEATDARRQFDEAEEALRLAERRETETERAYMAAILPLEATP